MKKAIILSFLTCFCFLAQGQNADTLQAAQARYYVGMGLNGRYFEVDYDNSVLETSGYFMANPYLHIGYRLNKRVRLEAGFAYVGERNHSYVTYVEAPGKYINYHDYSQTRGVTMPLKATHDLFHVFRRRLAVYGTGSVLPTYSKTRVWEVEEKSNGSTTTFDVSGSAVNVFASVGIGASFRIWRRFSGYHEANVWTANLTTGRSIDPFWFEKSQRPLSHLSLGLGVNYDLKSR